jgi:hypothetical protein
MNEAINPRVDDVDAAIEAALDRALEGSFFAKPKQVCVLLGISLSTYNRAIRAGLIWPTPRGDYWGVSRPALRSFLKDGLRSMTGKSAA